MEKTGGRINTGSGWCGQNGMLANALLCEALHSGDKEAETMGFRGGYWTAGWKKPRCRLEWLPVIMIRDRTDIWRPAIWERQGLAYFEAAQLSESLEVTAENIFRPLIGSVISPSRIQDRNGRFRKKCWHEDSVAIGRVPIGAFLVLPLLEGYRQSGDETT